MASSWQHRALLVGGAAFLVAVALVLCLGFRGSRPETGIKIGFTPFRAGSYGDWSYTHGDLFYSDRFTVAFVTNRTRFPMMLRGGRLQWSRPDGSVVNNNAVHWGGEADAALCAPQDVAAIPLEVPKAASSYRFIFQWDRDGGRLKTLASSLVRKLPPGRMNGNVYLWLWAHGWVDGVLHLTYQTPWLANREVPSAQASSPSQSTNRTAAVGSKGSSPSTTWHKE